MMKRALMTLAVAGMIAVSGWAWTAAPAQGAGAAGAKGAGASPGGAYAMAGPVVRDGERPGLPAALVRGLVIPDKQVVLNAPLDGRLAKLMVEEGDLVKEGQELAEMDSDVQKRAVEVARIEKEKVAEARSAALAVEEEAIKLGNVTDAHKRGGAQDWEVRQQQLRLDQAKAAAESAKEKLAVAKATWELESEKLRHFVVRAPFAGRIIRVSTEAGATLRNTDPVLSIAALHPLEAQVNVPAERYGEMKVGQYYKLAAGQPVNKELQGKCKVIDPVIDAGSRTFRCVFVIENADMSLPAGFAVNLVGK